MRKFNQATRQPTLDKPLPYVAGSVLDPSGTGNAALHHTPTYNFLLPSTSRTLLTLSCFPPVRALALTELFEWLKNHLLVKNRLLCVWKHSYRSTSTDCHRSLISPTVALPAEVNPAASIVFPKTLSSYLFTHQRQSRSATSKCIPLGLQIQTLISGGTRLFVAPGRFEH